MRFLTSLVLEDFISLCLIWGCAIVLWLAIWYVRRYRAGARVALILVLLAAGSLVLEMTVVTDREGMDKLLDEVLDACRSGDVAALGASLDRDFVCQSLDREQILRHAERLFSAIRVTRLRVLGLQIDPFQRPPTAKLKVFAQVADASGNDLGADISTWQLDFVRRGERWYLLEARTLSWDLGPARDLELLLREAGAL